MFDYRDVHACMSALACRLCARFTASFLLSIVMSTIRFKEGAADCAEADCIEANCAAEIVDAHQSMLLLPRGDGAFDAFFYWRSSELPVFTVAMADYPDDLPLEQGLVEQFDLDTGLVYVWIDSVLDAHEAECEVASQHVRHLFGVDADGDDLQVAVGFNGTGKAMKSLHFIIG